MTRWTAATASVLLTVLLVGGCRDPSVHAADAGRACTAASACAPREYCAYTPGLCGKGKRPGACSPRPAACPDTPSPVCGCDGRVYASECEAHAGGLDLDVQGGCREHLPAGWAPCGARFCDARTSYCEIVLSDVFELPTDFTCRPLPASCRVEDGGASRTCACFPQGTRCLSFCGTMDTGGAPAFHLTCRL